MKEYANQFTFTYQVLAKSDLMRKNLPVSLALCFQAT